MKRLEEDCLRKSRQLDKLSLLAKEKTAAVQEKKREDDGLRQRCSKLELQLRDRDEKLRKLQGTQKSQSESAILESSRAPRSRLMSSNQHGGTSAELTKLREQIERLSQDNRRLALQVKEKEQEIRRLRCQSQLTPAPTRAATANRSQRPNSSRTGSASQPKRTVTTAKRSNTFSVTRGPLIPDSEQKASAVTAEKQTELASKQPQREHPIGASKSMEKAGPPAKLQQSAKAKPTELLDPRAENVRRNMAAKKIQRGWKDHKRRKSISKDISQLSAGGSRQKSITNDLSDISTGGSEISLGEFESARKRKNSRDSCGTPEE